MPRRKQNKQKKRKPSHNKSSLSRLPVVMPVTHTCRMKYTSTLIGVFASGDPYLSADWYINSPFLPETAGTDTTSAIGFTELVTLYSNWQVIRSLCSLTIANEEAFEVVVCVAPSTVRLKSMITSQTAAVQLGEMPWGKTTTLGRSSGMNRSQLSLSVPMPRLYGNAQFYSGDENNYGLTSNRPTNLMYYTFSVTALGSNNLTNGVTFRLSIEYTVKWSNRSFTDVDSLMKQSPPLMSVDMSQ